MVFMDMHLWDLLPVVICETAAIRNESGEIVDLEWTASNRLMNESIRTDGGSVVDVRDQATRILVAAMTQFDQDPMQAVRAIRQQAATLKCLAVRTADAKLAIAAAALEGNDSEFLKVS